MACALAAPSAGSCPKGGAPASSKMSRPRCDPSIPPAALASLIASWTAFRIGIPRKAVSPLSGMSRPILQVPGGRAAGAPPDLKMREATTASATAVASAPTRRTRRAFLTGRFWGFAQAAPAAVSMTA